MIDNIETIAAIATPPGTGGIGVIRVSGPLASTIYTSITNKEPDPKTFKFTAFKDSNGSTLDRGLALYFSAPASYTGEDIVELQGHGGQVVLSLLLKEVIHLGARLAKPGEFTERAFLNNKLDLVQAEAVSDLISSSSEQAARSAMRSLEGKFSKRINALLEELIRIRVFIEGALDFPEEEIDFISESDVEERIEKCVQSLREILVKAKSGNVLKEGVKVTIIGAPNVGKSSLLNALSQSDKAIVTDTPGTTRDLIEDNILIEGIRLNITDTAGIRKTDNNIEKEGIKRAEIAAQQADLLLLVWDANGTQDQQHKDLSFAGSAKIINIYNKIDLAGLKTKTTTSEDGSPEVYLSVKTGDGMELLYSLIKKAIAYEDTSEDVFSSRRRHIEALSLTKELLSKICSEFEIRRTAPELIAEDLHQAQKQLETITGVTTADDLLGEIFANFCIGK
jgi:tRNA modification GTPase